MLADESVVGEVEGVLEHALRGGALRVDLLGPLERDVFEFGVVGDLVDGAHAVHVVGGILAAEEEDFAGELLADHFGEVCAAVSAVERAHVGIGLLEAGVLARRDGEVAHHVERVSATGGPAGHDADDDLGHEANEALALENVQASGAAGVDGRSALAIGVAVAIAASDALIAARAERPAAILG